MERKPDKLLKNSTATFQTLWFLLRYQTVGRLQRPSPLPQTIIFYPLEDTVLLLWLSPFIIINLFFNKDKNFIITIIFGSKNKILITSRSHFLVFLNSYPFTLHIIYFWILSCIKYGLY